MPVNLAPPAPQASSSPAPFFCTDRKGAESIAVAYRENADCHAQLKNVASGTDWGTVIVAAVVAGLLGFAIGSAK